MEINKITRLQKLQGMFKIKEIMETAKEATSEKLEDKDMDLAEIKLPYLCSSNGY